MSPQQRFGFGAHLSHQGAVIPRRITDELLQALVIAAGQLLLNATDALAGVASQQPGQVVPGMLPHIAPMHNEVFLIVGAQFHEAVRKAAQAASVIFYLGGLDPPVTSFYLFILFGFASRRLARTEDHKNHRRVARIILTK